MSRRYALITPCRDESAFLATTIHAVAAQTVPPHVWIVVDDGSTDDSPRILREACEAHPFIRVVPRPDRGERRVGPGVIEAFYDGFAHLDLDEVDYVCKFDADLDIKPVYFERVMEQFERDAWLGTFSGKLYLCDEQGHERPERCGDENSVGNIKFYRKECFDDIGGFVREVCWDGIDGHMCRMKGWVAASRDDDDLRIIHLRQMGTSHQGIWTGRKRWGRGKHFMGTAPYYAAAVAIYRLFERPFVVGGIGIFTGYMGAWLRRDRRFESPGFREFLRGYELRALLTGKRRSAQRWNDRVRRTCPPMGGRPADPEQRDRTESMTARGATA